MHALASAHANNWIILFKGVAEILCTHLCEKGLVTTSALHHSFITEILAQVIHEYSVEFGQAWTLEYGKLEFIYTS